MKTVRVSVGQLIDKLEENKTKHVKEFEDTLEGWRQDVYDELCKATELFRVGTDGDDRSVKHIFNKPASYEKEYDLAIQMAYASVELEVELSQREFDQYFNDNWDWSHSFKTSTSLYNKRV